MKVKTENLYAVTELIADVQRLNSTLKRLGEKMTTEEDVYFDTLTRHHDESGDLSTDTTPVNVGLLMEALQQTKVNKTKALHELGVEIE